jgi:hypothetical protein
LAAAAAGKGDKNLPVYRGIIRAQSEEGKEKEKKEKKRKEKRDKEKAVRRIGLSLSLEAARANKKPKKSWTSPVASAAV